VILRPIYDDFVPAKLLAAVLKTSAEGSLKQARSLLLVERITQGLMSFRPEDDPPQARSEG
jgi:hypothetical protein